jgi:Kef-type K+ transport system membrane component KefB
MEIKSLKIEPPTDVQFILAQSHFIKTVEDVSECLLNCVPGTKFGCGLPSFIFLRNKSKAMKVGIGMISRGEVGLIVAGIGVTSGVLSSNVYTTVIIMIAITTLITPIWLKKAYSKETAIANDDSQPIR